MKKLSERELWRGYRRIIERVFEHPETGQQKRYDIKYEGTAACVVALTPEREVILVEQFRPGPEKYLLELPGGGVDHGETPEQAAARELLEETGYAGDLQYVGPCLDCAYSTLVRHVFVATNCKQLHAPTGTEWHLKVKTLSLSDFRAHLRSGMLSDVECGYLGLDHLGLL